MAEDYYPAFFLNAPEFTVTMPVSMAYTFLGLTICLRSEYSNLGMN